MAPSPQQVGTRSCGCDDCLIDYPPEQYGQRPPREYCAGPWQVRHRAGRKQLQRRFRTRAEATAYCAAVTQEGGGRGA